MLRIVAQGALAAGRVEGERRKEATTVEFPLMCPNDGEVDLSLEDISAVVLRGPEMVDVVFACPHCGARIDASLRVPNLLSAAMELAQYADQMSDEGSSLEYTDGPLAEDTRAPVVECSDEIADSYCEYFRRQLRSVGSVEDLLAEIDAQ